MKDNNLIGGEVYPCIIIPDRYDGCYSGASWTAWNLYIEGFPYGPESGDSECYNFWQDYKGIVGKGNTPQEAYNDLKKQIIMRDGQQEPKKKKR